MRFGFPFSLLLHSIIILVGWFGLPFLHNAPITTEDPIIIEFLNLEEVKVAEKSNIPISPALKEKLLDSVSVPKAEPEPKVQMLETLIQAKPKRKPPPPPQPDVFTSVLKAIKDLEKTQKTLQNEQIQEKSSTDTTDFQHQIRQALTKQEQMTNVFDASKAVTLSEIDLVRNQIAECWNIPTGAKDAENLMIEIKAHMNLDGTVRRASIVNKLRLSRDPFFRTAAESALRAVLNPRCQPFKLPPDKFSHWRNLTLNFNPREMFR